MADQLNIEDVKVAITRLEKYELAVIDGHPSAHTKSTLSRIWADFKAARTLLSRLSSEAWAVVPREPTEAMLTVGHQEIDWARSDENTQFNEHPSQTGTTCKRDLADAYRAMITAAERSDNG